MYFFFYIFKSEIFNYDQVRIILRAFVYVNSMILLIVLGIIYYIISIFRSEYIRNVFRKVSDFMGTQNNNEDCIIYYVNLSLVTIAEII